MTDMDFHNLLKISNEKQRQQLQEVIYINIDK